MCCSNTYLGRNDEYLGATLAYSQSVGKRVHRLEVDQFVPAFPEAYLWPGAGLFESMAIGQVQEDLDSGHQRATYQYQSQAPRSRLQLESSDTSIRLGIRY